MLLIEKYKIQAHWGGLCKHYISIIKLGQKYCSFWLWEKREEARSVSDIFFLNTKEEELSLCGSLPKVDRRSLTPVHRTQVLLSTQLSTLLQTHPECLRESLGEFW